ncbi:MAG: hypothetical protein IT353_25015 [Gemmatimonadaceae bacterium]|nr:hypothetical protein [Gemmatimonadaceae bacterium]
MSSSSLMWRRSGMRRVIQIATMVGVVGLVACDATTSPDTAPSLNAAEALRDYQALDSVFRSDGWAAFTALSGRTPLSARASVASVATLRDAAGDPSGRQFAVNLLRAMAASPTAQPTTTDASGSASAHAPILSDTIRGRTMTFDATSGQYRVNGSRTGAPSNGVRFVLYAVDAANVPIASQEIGYADLIDEGAVGSSDVVLRLVAVERGTTILSYRTRASQTNTQGRIAVDGYVADGTNRLTFDIEAIGVTLASDTEIEVRFDLSVASRDFRVTGSVRGIEGGAENTGTVELTARHRDQTMTVEMSGDGATTQGEILFNGRTFVTVSGNAANPTLRGASGNAITGQELLVVLSIIDTVDDVFDLVEELVEPVDNVVALAWLL